MFDYSKRISFLPFQVTKLFKLAFYSILNSQSQPIFEEEEVAEGGGGGGGEGRR